jgi:hypothetical protein
MEVTVAIGGEIESGIKMSLGDSDRCEECAWAPGYLFEFHVPDGNGTVPPHALATLPRHCGRSRTCTT